MVSNVNNVVRATAVVLVLLCASYCFAKLKLSIPPLVLSVSFILMLFAWLTGSFLYLSCLGKKSESNLVNGKILKNDMADDVSGREDEN